jgi:hypothetical protein
MAVKNISRKGAKEEANRKGELVPLRLCVSFAPLRETLFQEQETLAK